MFCVCVRRARTLREEDIFDEQHEIKYQEMEIDYECKRLREFGYSDEEIDEHIRKLREKFNVESFTKNFGTVWQKEDTEEGTVHFTTIEIKPHTSVGKGKRYNYGRIQLTVDSSWVGLKAKIKIIKPKQN